MGATCETSECSEDSPDHLDSTKTVVEFIKVKNRKGKITTQAIVNDVKFYCNKTEDEGRRKTFRCSYYDSEKCRCRFTAIKIDLDTESEWEVEEIGNASQDFHEQSRIETLISKAKVELRQCVLASAADKRLKDI